MTSGSTYRTSEDREKHPWLGVADVFSSTDVSTDVSSSSSSSSYVHVENAQASQCDRDEEAKSRPASPSLETRQDALIRQQSCCVSYGTYPTAPPATECRPNSPVAKNTSDDAGPMRKKKKGRPRRLPSDEKRKRQVARKAIWFRQKCTNFVHMLLTMYLFVDPNEWDENFNNEKHRIPNASDGNGKIPPETLIKETEGNTDGLRDIIWTILQEVKTENLPVRLHKPWLDFKLSPPTLQSPNLPPMVWDAVWQKFQVEYQRESVATEESRNRAFREFAKYVFPEQNVLQLTEESNGNSFGERIISWLGTDHTLAADKKRVLQAHIIATLPPERQGAATLKAITNLSYLKFGALGDGLMAGILYKFGYGGSNRVGLLSFAGTHFNPFEKAVVLLAVTMQEALRQQCTQDIRENLYNTGMETIALENPDCYGEPQLTWDNVIKVSSVIG